jgi:hypothetical protein
MERDDEHPDFARGQEDDEEHENARPDFARGQEDREDDAPEG